MATVQVQGIDIHIREQGQGPPVLFLHGNPDSGAVWDQVVALMAPQFQCIAPDLPGFGESGPGDRFDPALANLAPQLSRDQINQMFDNFDLPMKRMILRFYRATDPENFQGWEDELASLLQTKPALVLWGDQDPFIPPQFAAKLGAQTVKQFPDQGHWPMPEDPQMVATHLIELFIPNPA